jgi:hypothetical protein
MRRHLEIFLKLTRGTTQKNPSLEKAIKYYFGLLHAMDLSREQVLAQLNAICKPYGIRLGPNT